MYVYTCSKYMCRNNGKNLVEETVFIIQYFPSYETTLGKLSG